MELNLTTILAKEQAYLAIQNSQEEEKELERLISMEVRCSFDWLGSGYDYHDSLEHELAFVLGR